MIFLIVAVVVFVVFFFLFPRPALIALAVFIVAGGGIAAFFYSQQSGRDDMARLVVGKSSTRGCETAEKPVFVELSNGSDRAINTVRFRLIAKRPGFSIETYSDYLSSYKIIGPHETYGTCWALNSYRGLQTLPGNPSPGDLDWSVEISSVEFAGDN